MKFFSEIVRWKDFLFVFFFQQNLTWGSRLSLKSWETDGTGIDGKVLETNIRIRSGRETSTQNRQFKVCEMKDNLKIFEITLNVKNNQGLRVQNDSPSTSAYACRRINKSLFWCWRTPGNQKVFGSESQSPENNLQSIKPNLEKRKWNETVFKNKTPEPQSFKVFLSFGQNHLATNRWNVIQHIHHLETLTLYDRFLKIVFAEWRRKEENSRRQIQFRLHSLQLDRWWSSPSWRQAFIFHWKWWKF